jgi:hypothetical protein
VAAVIEVAPVVVPVPVELPPVTATVKEPAAKVIEEATVIVEEAPKVDAEAPAEVAEQELSEYSCLKSGLNRNPQARQMKRPKMRFHQKQSGQRKILVKCR